VRSIRRQRFACDLPHIIYRVIPAKANARETHNIISRSLEKSNYLLTFQNKYHSLTEFAILLKTEIYENNHMAYRFTVIFDSTHSTAEPFSENIGTYKSNIQRAVHIC